MAAGNTTSSNDSGRISGRFLLWASARGVLVLALGFVSPGVVLCDEQPDVRGLLPCFHEISATAFGGLVIVPLELNGSIVGDFVVDSGANQSALHDPLLATLLGAEGKARGLVRGVGAGAARVSLSRKIRVAGGGRSILEIPFVVNDIADRLERKTGRRFDGLIGWELFDHYVVEIDPSQGKIRLYDPESFTYSGEGEVLQLHIEDRRPVVDGLVTIVRGKETRVRLLVDTGSAWHLTLLEGSKRRLKAPRDSRRSRSSGVVGSAQVMLARTSRLDLGRLTATDLETAWVESGYMPAASRIENLHGVLGNALLARYRTFFDYRRGRLILEPL